MTIQLEEAKALIERNSAAHGRLAFILLDNAAEVLMLRNVEALLSSRAAVLRDLITDLPAAGGGLTGGTNGSGFAGGPLARPVSTLRCYCRSYVPSGDLSPTSHRWPNGSMKPPCR
jgi:hypothetical protein